MNGAIAAAALDYDFPHIYDPRKFSAIAPKLPGAPVAQAYEKNPFFNAWVKLVDIQPMLTTSDLAKGIPYSLLNSGVLKDIASQIVHFSGPPANPETRAWLLNPYEVRLTVTNLRGVPFAYDLQTENPDAHQGFLMHADHMAFSVKHGGAGPTGPVRPDCIVLGPTIPRQSDTWGGLGLAGLATGAFPIALSARDLTRDAAEYLWRYSFYDVDQRKPVFANPVWPSGKPDANYAFACVDGGVMNNEPFEIARGNLAGPRGENPQGGDKADRAVIVIDPFVEDPEQGSAGNANIFDAGKGIISGWKNQTRMSMQDLIQIQREDVYSRFMVAPARTSRATETVFGQEALATSALGAFAGFFCEDYRRHDFLLGRRNAQKFLRDIFVLPEQNPLFADDRWSEANKAVLKSVGKGGSVEFPVIPLCGHLLSVAEPTPAWPRGAHKANRDTIATAVSKRIEAVIKVVAPAFVQQLSGPSSRGKPGFFSRIGSRIGGWAMSGLSSFAAAKLSGRVVTAALAEIDDAYDDIDKRPFD